MATHTDEELDRVVAVVAVVEAVEAELRAESLRPLVASGV